MRTEVTWMCCPDDAIELVLDPPLAAVLPLEVDDAAPGLVEPEPLDDASVPVISTSWPLCCARSDSRPSRTYVEPLIAMPLELPLPAVPAVAPVLAPLVEPDALGLVDDAPLEPEPMRALVSVYCAPLVREVVDADPAVPLVPVAPEVPVALPPCRHPVTVIARLLEEV